VCLHDIMDLEKLDTKKDSESVCVFLFNGKLMFYSHDCEKEVMTGVEQIIRNNLYREGFCIDPNYKIEKDVIVNMINDKEMVGIIYKLNFMKYPVNELYKYGQIEDTIEVFRIIKRFDLIEGETLDEL